MSMSSRWVFTKTLVPRVCSFDINYKHAPPKRLGQWKLQNISSNSIPFVNSCNQHQAERNKKKKKRFLNGRCFILFMEGNNRKVPDYKNKWQEKNINWSRSSTRVSITVGYCLLSFLVEIVTFWTSSKSFIWK